jgi:hypothetical protein
MVTVPANTYFGRVIYPDGTPLALDPHQYEGYSIQTDRNCQELFGTRTGPQFCDAYCMNSCPMLNPDAVAGTEEAIAQSQTILNYVQPAITAASKAVSQSNTLVKVTGYVIFNVTGDISLNVASLIILDIQTKLSTALNNKIAFQVRCWWWYVV